MAILEVGDEVIVSKTNAVSPNARGTLAKLMSIFGQKAIIRYLSKGDKGAVRTEVPLSALTRHK